MSAVPTRALRAEWLYGGLAVLGVAVSFGTLPSRPLFNPDEGRYAEIPREMLASGDWVIPHLDGLDYIEKPPLQYWASAVAQAVLGRNELGARFYTALCAAATLGVVWWTARRLWGAAAAWRSAAVASSMLLFVILGQLLTLDMSLTFYMTMSLAAFLVAQQAVSPESARRFMLVAWCAAALGVLTKGVVAAAVPVAVLVLYSAVARDAAPWRRLYATLGLPLFLLLTVPWHWLAARRLPDFLEFYFVHEHLARYLTPSAGREQVWWFFAAVFVLGSVPWTLSALRALATGWRRQAPHGQFDARRFLWVWVVFIGVFFSLSDSKLIPYILPAMPACALLIASPPADTLERDLTWTGWFTVATGLSLVATVLSAPRWLAVTERNHYFAELKFPLLEIAALLIVSGLFVMLRRRDATQTAVFLGVGWCLTGLLLMRGAAVVAPIYSGSVLARAGIAIPRAAPLYSVGTYDQTLPFYWARTVTLVAYRGELDFGLHHDTVAELPSVADFVAEWRVLPVGFAVMERPLFDDLSARGVPMREMARDLHRVLVARQ